MLIKNSISFQEDKTFSDLELELINVKLTFKNQNIYILSLYNPPNRELSYVLFEKITKFYPNFRIGGDLNSKSANI